MSGPPDQRGFDEMYVGVPPWDIGRAQPEVVRLADASGFVEPVIDVGCGTGENALDSGVFHVFEDDERPVYVASLATALAPGGALQLLCFSDLQPGTFGPRRVTQGEIRETFADGWDVREIAPVTFVTNLPELQAKAWR